MLKKLIAQIPGPDILEVLEEDVPREDPKDLMDFPHSIDDSHAEKIVLSEERAGEIRSLAEELVLEVADNVLGLIKYYPGTDMEEVRNDITVDFWDEMKDILEEKHTLDTGAALDDPNVDANDLKEVGYGAAESVLNNFLSTLGPDKARELQRLFLSSKKGSSIKNLVAQLKEYSPGPTLTETREEVTPPREWTEEEKQEEMDLLSKETEEKIDILPDNQRQTVEELETLIFSLREDPLSIEESDVYNIDSLIKKIKTFPVTEGLFMALSEGAYVPGGVFGRGLEMLEFTEDVTDEETAKAMWGDPNFWSPAPVDRWKEIDRLLDDLEGDMVKELGGNPLDPAWWADEERMLKEDWRRG